MSTLESSRELLGEVLDMGSAQPIPMVVPNPFPQEFSGLTGQIARTAADPFNPFMGFIEQGLGKQRDEAKQRLFSSAQRAGAFSSSDTRRHEQELENQFLRDIGAFRYGQLESGQNRGVNVLAALRGQPVQQQFAPSGFAQMIGGLGSLLGPLASAGAVKFANPIRLGK